MRLDDGTGGWEEWAQGARRRLGAVLPEDQVNTIVEPLKQFGWHINLIEQALVRAGMLCHCPMCIGSGQVNGTMCNACYGSGRALPERDVEKT